MDSVDELKEIVRALKRKLVEVDRQRKKMDGEFEEKRNKMDEEQAEVGEKMELLDKKVEEINVKSHELDEKESQLDIRETTIFDKEDFLEEKEVKLQKIEEKIYEEREDLNSSKRKMMKEKKLVQLVKDKLECPVCLEVPRSRPVPVCPNGHLVCKNCKTVSCPTCRADMGGGKSLLALTIIENIEHSCKFDLCEENHSFEEIEQHEAVCEHRSVACPKINCGAEVPLSKLVYHLLNSESCCHQKEKLSGDLGIWIERGYRFQANLHGSWPVKVYSIDGEDFVVFPKKSEGYYYFLPIIFASDAKASEYEFEIVVHERGLDVHDSKLAVKFLGNPLSIDLEKKKLDMFGTSEQLVDQIRIRSNTGASFSLSFKISKS